MRCPFCQSLKTKVNKTDKPDRDGGQKRYRKCLVCGKSFRTKAKEKVISKMPNINRKKEVER